MHDDDTRDTDGTGSSGDGGRDVRERPFLRAAAAVGDLGSPFYDEERRRDVWNEASAVGFQLWLWLGLLTANTMAWLGGEDGLPYAVATFVLVAVTSGVVVGYARRLGVRADMPEHQRPAALVAVAGLVVAFVLGVAFSQQWPDDGFLGGFADGLAVGGVLGGLAGLLGILWDLRRVRRHRDR